VSVARGAHKTVTTINGRRVPRSKARISVFDNSLLYAEGLFETLLAVDDRVLFVDEHLDRLYRGARVIGLTVPVDRPTLARWMHAAAGAHPARIKMLRLTITSGESARYLGVAGKPQVILSAAPYRIPEKPFRLLVADWRVDQDSVFRQIKTISYAINAAALRRAKQRGYDDALLLNERDQVAEVSSANIFWVKRGLVYTPPLTAGCLEGTTRKTVLRVARKLGIRIIERTEQIDAMLRADEVFITSSLKLVVAVSAVRYRNRSYRWRTGDLTRRLSAELQRIAGV